MERIKNAERQLQPIFYEIEEICFKNSKKVLEAFHLNQLSESHFSSTTGYGYNDIGRDTIEKIYATIFKCEDALVRSQFISGSHALTVTLFALLRPKDTLLSISGTPYDTLHEVIGIKENVIIGKLIPAGTGLKKYRTVVPVKVETDETDVG